MAIVMYLFLAVMVIAFSSVENAPSTINNKRLGDELQLRLVFVNRNDENTISSSSPAFSGRNQPNISPLLQKSRLAKTEQLTEPVFAPLAINAAAAQSTTKPRMDDDRQNWGLIIEEKAMIEDESYYNRPLSIPKIVNTKALVDHKLAKSANKSSVITPSSPMKPSACDTAIITCCAKPSNLRECFNSVGCSNATEDMFTHLCSDSSIIKTIEDFARYYKRD